MAKKTGMTKEDKEQKEPFTGFNEIALCFSGGGYRAACFSLGTLSFFEEIGLLQNVKVVSTVSGGTITGVKYAQSQAVGKEFGTFFSNYFSWLRKDNLTTNAIQHIKKRKIWNREENKHKRKNPINAFAIEYNSFTAHMTMGDIQDAIKCKKTHLEKVVFNTTDFSHSLKFKFQNISQGVRFGNTKVYDMLDDGDNLNNYVSHFKLGDILASSAAFPGGFEPIGFPNDFVKEEVLKINEVGLMDGGIIDNQGITSVLGEKEYDLYFISDVASPYDYDPFEFSKDNTAIRILNFLANPMWFFILVALTVFFWSKAWPVLYALGIVFSTASLILLLLFQFANYKIKKDIGIQEQFIILPRRFGFYLFDRIQSLLKMTTTVFLKSARRSNYDDIYDVLRTKTATSAIYELRCCNEEEKPENQKEWDDIKAVTGKIPEKMRKVADYAALFGTTLWFNEDEKKKGMLDAVVACGEFTACYNLLAFMIRNYENEIAEGGVLHGLFSDTKVRWEQFKVDPYFLLASRIGSEKVKRLDYCKHQLCS